MKLKSVYVCSNCGETSPRWMGRLLLFRLIYLQKFLVT